VNGRRRSGDQQKGEGDAPEHPAAATDPSGRTIVCSRTIVCNWIRVWGRIVVCGTAVAKKETNAGDVREHSVEQV
jgi:hypothetical protein